MPTVEKHQNRLSMEKSPYLLQHAGNPVQWYPWGEEAFEKARSEDKPIFLSIGYSTCHWCHVMEQESFEDEDLARLMNATFIPIKVDREERPDIDQIYMTVCQTLTGNGGWPLTIIMTPDKKPFFAATYLPREDQPGMSGLTTIVQRIKELWSHRKNEALMSADMITEALNKVLGPRKKKQVGLEVLHSACSQLADSFDDDNGGFGEAPKFPIPHLLMFLLRYHHRTGRKKALDMVNKTLTSMRAGGIYDQVGFGFHRYSTDSQWLVPHFEKMLYDQALTAMAYLTAWQVTGDEAHARTAREIFTYVLRDMTSPEGAFYTAEDADTNGREGSFYLFTTFELEAGLGREDADFAERVFGLDRAGNLKGQVGMENPGKNILHMTVTEEEGARIYGTSVSEFRERLDRVRQGILNLRQKRTRPQLDDKVLTDWNSLMISALAKGGAMLGEPSYTEAAVNAFSFLETRLAGNDGIILHRWRAGESAIDGRLDDYAFFLQAALDLYETTFEPGYLKTAISVSNELIRQFNDSGTGGFFLSPVQAGDLIARPRIYCDGALPAGNSVAALALLRLSRLTANPKLEAIAVGVIGAVSMELHFAPTAYTYLLGAVDFLEGPSQEVVIAGDPADHGTAEMIKKVRSMFLPNAVLLFKPSGESGAEIAKYAGFLEKYVPIKGKASAFVCRDHVCGLPTNDPDILVSQLQNYGDS